MNPINERKIKLFGSANINQSLPDNERFVDLTIKNATLSDDQIIRGNKDGTADLIYKIIITNETELTILALNEIIKSKRKGSLSQLLRFEIEGLWNEQYVENIEKDDYYKKRMLEFIKIIQRERNNFIQSKNL